MPALPFFIAFVSLLTGMNVFSVIRFVLPLVGATTVVSGFFVARELFRDRTLAFLSAAFLAFDGLFVYVTSAAMKENFALAVFLLSLFLFVRKDRVVEGSASVLFRVLWFLSMVFLFLAHHLTFLVAVAVSGMALCFRAWNLLLFSKPRKDFLGMVLDLSLLFSVAVLGFLYYRWVSLSYLRFFRGGGLYLFLSSFAFWLFVGLVAFFFSSSEDDGKKAFSWRLFFGPFCVLVAGLGLVFFNTRFAIFGTVRTPFSYLFALVPYCVVVFFSLVGVSVVRRTSFYWKELVAGGIMAPLSLITFAVAGGVDVASFNLAYRTYNYVDMFLGFFFGVGVLFFLKKLGSVPGSVRLCGRLFGRFSHRYTLGHRAFASEPLFRCEVGGAAKHVAVVFAVLLLFSTSSLGFMTPKVHGVEDVTDRWEFDGLSALAEVVGVAGSGGVVYTDQRYSDILRQYFMVNSSPDLPYLLRDNRSLPVGFFVVSEEWTTRGAQEYPYGTVQVSEEQIERLFREASFLFSVGPEGHRLLVFGNPGSCGDRGCGGGV